MRPPVAINSICPRPISWRSGRATARSGLVPLFAALALAKTEVPLLVVGEADGIAELVTAAGLTADRVRVLGTLSDADLAVALRHASALVVASVRDGFGTTMLEAFSLGTPVIHADAPVLLEIADDAGIAVPSGDANEYPAALAEAIDRFLADKELRRTLGILGLDRAKFFSWRAAAESVWQLHADL